MSDHSPHCQGCSFHNVEAAKLAMLKAHAGDEATVRSQAEEAMRESGMMPGTRHSDEFIDMALRQIEEKAKDVSALLLATALMLPAAESACDIINGGVQFIRRRAHEALQPVTVTDPPDNGCITSPGEMAGNPSCNDINEHATRRLGGGV